MLIVDQFVAGLIGASQATSYSGLMIARVFHGFGRSVQSNAPGLEPNAKSQQWCLRKLAGPVGQRHFLYP